MGDSSKKPKIFNSVISISVKACPLHYAARLFPLRNI